MWGISTRPRFAKSSRSRACSVWRLALHGPLRGEISILYSVEQGAMPAQPSARRERAISSRVGQRHQRGARPSAAAVGRHGSGARRHRRRCGISLGEAYGPTSRAPTRSTMEKVVRYRAAAPLGESVCGGWRHHGVLRRTRGVREHGGGSDCRHPAARGRRAVARRSRGAAGTRRVARAGSRRTVRRDVWSEHRGRAGGCAHRGGARRDRAPCRRRAPSDRRARRCAPTCSRRDARVGSSWRELVSRSAPHCLRSASGWIVLRCVNRRDDAVQGRWRLGVPVIEAMSARLDETPLGALRTEGGTVYFDAKPREIVTVLARVLP